MTVIFYYEEKDYEAKEGDGVTEVQIESCDMPGVAVGQEVHFTFDTLLRDPNLRVTYSEDAIAEWQKHNNTGWRIESVNYDVSRYPSGTRVTCWAKVKRI